MKKQVVLISTLEEMEKAFTKIIENLSKNPIQQPERIMLNRAQAAKFCSMGYHTFGLHTRSGKFIERGIGRKKFFYKDELIQALNEKNAKA